MIEQVLRIGVVVNPYAGVGGAAAFKGSDALEIQQAAQTGQLTLVAGQRVRTFLQRLHQTDSTLKEIEFIVAPGVLGGKYFADQSVNFIGLNMAVTDYTNAQDTKSAVIELQQQGIDLLIFVGGDGTARDVCSAIRANQLVLGIPSGVKMHSAVFAVSPSAAAELISKWLAGHLVSAQMQEVRDIDESMFRQGKVVSSYFGEMLTLSDEQYTQHVKQGGFEVEELVLADIAEELQAFFDENGLVILGPGSTTYNIAKNWNLETSLLGVDVLQNKSVIARDVSAQTLMELSQNHQGPIHLVITAIGGQGHIIGRGNQQLSPALLRLIGRDRVNIVATKTKLASLKGRPFLMDSGDPLLDQQWSGVINVICGYNDRVLYRLGYAHG